MSQGRKELRRIQLKLESTPGAYTAGCRYLWRGMADMPTDQREVIKREELSGVFGGYDDSYIAKYMGEITLGETDATFEQLPIPLAAGGFGSAGGTAHGASGSSVAFYFPIPASTVWPQQTFMIEAGEPAQGLGGEAEIGTYGVCTEIKFSGAMGEAIKLETTWTTRTWERTNASGSFGTVGTAATVETILAGRGTVWLDQAVAAATFGNSQSPAGNILGFELTLKPKWAFKFPVDSGQLYYSTAVYTGCDIEGNLMFEHQSVGSTGAAGTAGQKQQWRDQRAQLLRMQWTGTTIPEGTTFLSSMLQISLPIKWTTFDALDDIDGNSTITGNYTSTANASVPAAVGRGTILVVRRGQLEML